MIKIIIIIDRSSIGTIIKFLHSLSATLSLKKKFVYHFVRFQLNNFSNPKGTGVFLKVSSRRSIASSECIALLRCTRDVKPLLWGLNVVVDASLRGEIQILWARLGTETNFMLMPHSSRNFNFPAHGYLNFWKLVPRGRNHVQMPHPRLFF